MDDATGEQRQSRDESKDEQIEIHTGVLRDYARVKYAIAQAVRSIRGLAHELKNDTAENDGQELMTKLAEDRFTLAGT